MDESAAKADPTSRCETTTLAEDVRAAIDAAETAKKRFYAEFAAELSGLPEATPIALKLSYLYGDEVRWCGISHHRAESAIISQALYEDLCDLLEEVGEW